MTALTHARVIDCTGRPPEEDAAVVVEDGRIREVARSGAAPRSGATVIDCRGHTLMPGLTDAHVHVGMLGSVADGVDEVRRAVREELRRGADQIKVMASGGAASPTDELDTTQYSVPELRAAVEEARAVGTYVTVHAYSGTAIENAMQAGARCVEHGNLMHEGAARAMKAAGAFLVPTMVASLVIERDGARYGVSAETMRKSRIVRARAVESLELAHRTGLRIGSGSDLLGPMNVDQALELALKAQVLSPMEVLVSATRTNAELFGLEAEVGTVEPGKRADLLVVRGDPLRDLRLFQSPAENLLLIMKAGAVVKSLL